MLKKFLKKKRGKQGFTLIELLVTITIVSIMSIMTFAITLSSLNTFQKEKDIIDAMDMKEIICTMLKEHLRKRSKIGLLNENIAAPQDVSIPEPLYGESYKDGGGYYVIDSRLKEYHMLYTDGGRIYTVTSNLDGKYYINDAVGPSDLSVKPKNMKSDANPNGKYGCIPFMYEDMYEGYYIDLTFKPIFTNVQGRYRDLQVIVDIYDDKSMTETHKAYSGSETFHLLNVENRQTAIKFQNDAYVYIENPTNRAPQKDGFKFCYFA